MVKKPGEEHWVPGFRCDGCRKKRILTDDHPEELHEVSRAMGAIFKRRFIMAVVAEQLLIAAGAGIGWLAGSWIAGLVVGAIAGTCILVPALIVFVTRRHLK